MSYVNLELEPEPPPKVTVPTPAPEGKKSFLFNLEKCYSVYKIDMNYYCAPFIHGLS